MNHICLLIAGGIGSRMHLDIPKQFFTVNDRPVIVYTLEAFENHPSIDAIAVSCIAGWENVLKEYAEQYHITKLKHIIPGGRNGQESIRNGIFELEKHYRPDDLVLIHDGNRPLVSEAIITDNIRVAKEHGNAVTVIPCIEAMVETADGATSSGSYPRDNLKRSQTPQAFYLGDICELHRKAIKKGITDSISSCTLKIEMGETVYFSAGSEFNIKLTTPEDLKIFKAFLAAKRANGTGEAIDHGQTDL